MKKKKYEALKYTAAALVIAAAGFTGGCAKKASSTEQISGVENGTQQEITLAGSETDASDTGADASGTESSDSQSASSGVLPLEVTTEYNNDWEDNKALLSVKTSQVHLLEKGHEALEKALDTLNQKNLNDQNTFFKENQEDARQMYQEAPEMFEDSHWESELTVMALRADETVVSLQQREYNWLGGAHPNTYSRGICYDTKTGKELSLQDIAADYDGIYDYVCQKLVEENDPDIFFEGYEDTVKAMFYGGDPDYGSVQWFLMNDRVVVLFNQYDIAPYAAGPIRVEIPFAERADLFEKQYETSKTSYVMQIQEYETLEADVNGDGKKEEISYTVDRDEYGIGGAITVTCDSTSLNTEKLIEQDYGASGGYSSEGYLIHTEDGKTYLYLQHQSDNDAHYINVFDLSKGTPAFVSSLDSSWSGSPVTDPDSFPLWDRMDVLGTYSAYRIYHVDADGLPKTSETVYRLGSMYKEYPVTLVSTRELEVTVGNDSSVDSWKQETLPSGTSYTIIATDGESFVEAQLTDGRICRIPVTKAADDWEWKINGVSENDCFEMVPYVG